MTASLDLNGKKLLPIKEVISQVDYSRDYITRLAREKKIVATQIGRMWYIDVDSLKNYQNVAQAEQEIKKRQLSDERKRELAFKEVKAEKHARAKLRVRRKTPAVVALMVVMAIGVGFGVLLNNHARTNFAQFNQLANVKTVAFKDVAEQPLTATDFVESARQAVSPEFAPHVSQRNLSATEGLLLLPVNASGTIEAQDYFSDPVTVTAQPDGTSVVRRVNQAGEPVGEEVPFILVPVNTNSP
jgi:hypothetical protein